MKLYTKTVCPKCMLMKFELNKLGLEGKYQIVNIEENEQAKQKLLSEGFLSVPVFEMDGVLMNDVASIKECISKIFV